MVKIAASGYNMQIGNFHNIFALKVLKILYGKSLVVIFLQKEIKAHAFFFFF